PRSASLEKQTPKPGSKPDQHKKESKLQITKIAKKRCGQREEIDDGSQHRKTHGDLEFFHPDARLGQEFEPGRMPRKNDVGSSQTNADGEENQNNDGRRLSEGEA